LDIIHPRGTQEQIQLRSSFTISPNLDLRSKIAHAKTAIDRNLSSG
jgi:hypothetical protein